MHKPILIKADTPEKKSRFTQNTLQRHRGHVIDLLSYSFRMNAIEYMVEYDRTNTYEQPATCLIFSGSLEANLTDLHTLMKSYCRY